jgi:hypothetical protein
MAVVTRVRSARAIYRSESRIVRDAPWRRTVASRRRATASTRPQCDGIPNAALTRIQRLHETRSFSVGIRWFVGWIAGDTSFQDVLSGGRDARDGLLPIDRAGSGARTGRVGRGAAGDERLSWSRMARALARRLRPDGTDRRGQRLDQRHDVRVGAIVELGGREPVWRASDGAPGVRFASATAARRRKPDRFGAARAVYVGTPDQHRQQSWRFKPEQAWGGR